MGSMTVEISHVNTILLPRQLQEETFKANYGYMPPKDLKLPTKNLAIRIMLYYGFIPPDSIFLIINSINFNYHQISVGVGREHVSLQENVDAQTQ